MSLGLQSFPTCAVHPAPWTGSVRGGQCGVRALWAGVAAEGWGFLEALGETALGESYHDYEERVLEAKIKEAELAHENLVRLRTRREILERKAGEIGGLRDGQGSIQNG